MDHHEFRLALVLAALAVPVDTAWPERPELVRPSEGGINPA